MYLIKIILLFFDIKKTTYIFAEINNEHITKSIANKKL